MLTCKKDEEKINFELLQEVTNSVHEKLNNKEKIWLLINLIYHYKTGAFDD